MAILMDNTPPRHIKFLDKTTGRHMKYVYQGQSHWTSGWILYRTRDKHWVTYRRATPEDIAAINQAVTEAHHQPPDEPASNE